MKSATCFQTYLPAHFSYNSISILFHVLHPAVNCGNPGTPSNGQRTGSSTTYNSVVTYTCNRGYTLIQGSNSRTCQSDGQWSGSLPRCDRKFSFVLVVLYIVSMYCLCSWIIHIYIYYIYIIHSNSPCGNSSPCTAGDPSFSHSLLTAYFCTCWALDFLYWQLL